MGQPNKARQFAPFGRGTAFQAARCLRRYMIELADIYSILRIFDG